MKIIVCVAIFLSGIYVSAQNFEQRWTGLFSYSEIKDLTRGNSKLIAASENAIFTYDFSTEELNTISTIQGLSGETITKVYYSETFDRIVIGYETGLIEIILEDNEVLKVVDILNKPTIPPTEKRINHFNEYNGNLYISTKYGISVYNLAALEFGDTYIIGEMGEQKNVNQTAVHEGFIYAAMNDRMKRASVTNPDLIDFQQWTDVYAGGIRGVQSFGEKLYGIDTNTALLSFTETNVFIEAVFPQQNLNIYSYGNHMTVTSLDHSTVFDLSGTQVAAITQAAGYEYTLTNSLAFNDKVYLGTREHGVVLVPFGGNQVQQILPDGPILNNPFAVDASPGQLWTVFGEVSVFFNPYPLNERGVSRLKDEHWTNIPFEELFGAVSISNVTINPLNPSEVFASSMLSGLLKIVDTIPTILYDQTNSNLVPVLGDNSIRIFGSEFDRQGNLWFVQNGSDTGLKMLNPAGQIQGFDITSVIPDPTDELGMNKLAISREGNIFFATSANGLVGYKPGANQFNKISEGTGTGNLPNRNVRALAFDNRNQLWIGTLRGLRVLYNVGGFFEQGANIESQPIIILEDGVAQELLFEQPITDIEVDGANNKWVATATSGVFYFSPNGQQTILRFTKDNSPLPSNTVQDITIDPQSGVVYFATVNGLVAYNGTATVGRDDLGAVRAFPNPVRPGFTGNVTIDGLTSRANVKITDVNGNLVFEQTSEGGSLLWDTTAFGKYKVASGVYFVMVSTEDASETKIAKIMIVR